MHGGYTVGIVKLDNAQREAWATHYVRRPSTKRLGAEQDVFTLESPTFNLTLSLAQASCCSQSPNPALGSVQSDVDIWKMLAWLPFTQQHRERLIIRRRLRFGLRRAAFSPLSRPGTTSGAIRS
jgi:hypothetical protein